MTQLKGKVAIVTGAGQGIGAATARLFAANGAAVVLADINTDTAGDVAEDILSAGGKAEVIRVDVADTADVEAMVATAERTLGSVDIIINNAGIFLGREPLAMTAEEWRRCMSIDLDGVWNCCKAVLPGMLERRRGAIVNMASLHSFQTIRSCFPYPVAKHGVIGITRSLAIEYADRGVRVNAICPGYIDTPINDAEFAKTPDPAAARAAADFLHPPRRMGTPEEVGNAALFLASDAASFVNGVSLMVDGGRSLVYND